MAPAANPMMKNMGISFSLGLVRILFPVLRILNPC